MKRGTVATGFVAIVLLALAVRFVHLYQVERLPTFYAPINDGRSYDEWSKRIAAGDWFGKEVFYQAPLYPYFLAVTQLVTGHDLWRIRVVQIVIGSVACGVLFLAGRRFFSMGSGVAAGVIAALYPPGIFFDALIQKAVLDVFFMCVLLWLIARLRDRPGLVTTIWVGVVLGCFSLTRENVLLFAPVIGSWLYLRLRAEPVSRRWKAIGCMALGMGLALGPVGLRNWKIGGSFLVTTSQFGPNFYIGNHDKATGCYVPLRPGRDDPAFERLDATDLAQEAEGRALTPGEVSGYWSGRALAWIRSEPAAWLRLLGTKGLWLVNSYEVPDAEDLYFQATQCSLIRVLGVAGHWGVVAPLAVAGILLTWARRRELWILYALLATLGLGILLFYMASRYRMPMVPILILFAGAGLVEAIRVVRRSGVMALDWVVVAAGLAAVPMNWHLIDPSSHTAMARSNMGSALLLQGKANEAIVEFEEAIRINPKLSTTYVNLSNAYWRAGRLGDSIASLRKALEVQPGDVEIGLELGNALAEHGELAEAEPLLRSALAIAHRRPEVYSSLGVLLVKQRRWDEAMAILRNGAEAAPEQVTIRANLAWNLATCPVDGVRNGAEAVRHAEACCKLTGFKNPRAFDVLAAAYAEAGRFDEAAVAEERALQLGATAPGFKDGADYEARLQLYQKKQAYRRAE